VQETLPYESLQKMHAPPKAGYPVITPDILATYDAFLVGIPTRYGNMPAQWEVRCFFFIHYTPLTFPHRHSGTPLVSSGPLESSQESTLVCFFQPEVWEAVKNPLLLR